MITQTHIATSIDSIPSGKSHVDQSIKELLADVQILAHILKYTTSEFRASEIDEIISYIDESQIEVSKTPVAPGLTNYGKAHLLSSENTILNEGTIYFDIRFSVRYGSEPLTCQFTKLSFGKPNYLLSFKTDFCTKRYRIFQ